MKKQVKAVSYSIFLIQVQIYFSKMQDKYAATTLRIVEHRQENMPKPGGLKHTKLLAIWLR